MAPVPTALGFYSLEPVAWAAVWTTAPVGGREHASTIHPGNQLSHFRCRLTHSENTTVLRCKPKTHIWTRTVWKPPWILVINLNTCSNKTYLLIGGGPGIMELTIEGRDNWGTSVEFHSFSLGNPQPTDYTPHYPSQNISAGDPLRSSSRTHPA